jgi:hypothetical protein
MLGYTRLSIASSGLVSAIDCPKPTLYGKKGMKTSLQQIHITASIIAGLALLAATTHSWADDLLVSGFDNQADANSWYWENWSAAGSSLAFDPAQDAAGSPESGSLQLDCNFNNSVDYQQAEFTHQFSSAPNLNNYSKVAIDVKVDEDSNLRTGATDYGHFEIVLRNGSEWKWNSIAYVVLTSTGWTHIEAPLPTYDPPLNTLSALTLKLGDGSFAGTVKLQVDNVTLLGQTAPVVTINAFDDESELSSYYFETWSTMGTLSFDAATDAGGSTNKGALKYAADLANDPTHYQQSVFSTTLAKPFDGLTYSKIKMDVKVDTANSVMRSGQSDYGHLEVILRNGSDWYWNSLGTFALTNSDWVHLEAVLSSPDDNVHHLTFKLGDNGYAGPVTIWIDNIQLVGNTNKTVTKPTLALVKTKGGLQLIASAVKSQYQRQSIRTADNGFSWVDAAQPVTYAVTISDFPSIAYPHFQAHIILVPAESAVANSFPDWSEPNIGYFHVVGQADGTAVAEFRYKTNNPNANPDLVGAITNSTPNGKWSVTFAQNTNVTIITPAGTNATFSIPPEAADLFRGPLFAYFGIQPNEMMNIGQEAMFSRAEISGVASPLSTVFVGDTLDSTVWAVAAEDANGIVMAPPTSKYWVSWTTPAAGFILQTSGTIEAGWKDVTTPVIGVNGKLQTLIKQSDLPAGDNAFFRLIKR